MDRNTVHSDVVWVEQDLPEELQAIAKSNHWNIRIRTSDIIYGVEVSSKDKLVTRAGYDKEETIKRAVEAMKGQ